MKYIGVVLMCVAFFALAYVTEVVSAVTVGLFILGVLIVVLDRVIVRIRKPMPETYKNVPLVVKLRRYYIYTNKSVYNVSSSDYVLFSGGSKVTVYNGLCVSNTNPSYPIYVLNANGEQVYP